MSDHNTLIFIGTSEGKHGLPAPFYRYDIAVSKWDGGQNAAIATIFYASEGAPMPKSRHFPTDGGGNAQAYALAKQELVKLNQKLKVIDDNSGGRVAKR